MSDPEQVYSFRNMKGNEKEKNLAPIEENEEEKEPSPNNFSKNYSNIELQEDPKMNIFQNEEKEYVIENKENPQLAQLSKAPDYVNTRKQIVSSQNLMLVQNKKKPLKRMVPKLNSFQVEPLKELNHKTCPVQNPSKFKFAVNFDDKNLNKTEKSVDNMSNNMMISTHPEVSKLNAKFSNNESSEKIQMLSERPDNKHNICFANISSNYSCSKCFIF